MQPHEHLRKRALGWEVLGGMQKCNERREGAAVLTGKKESKNEKERLASEFSNDDDDEVENESLERMIRRHPHGLSRKGRRQQ